MRPYVLRNRFLLSEDEPDVHARLRQALNDSFEVEGYAEMLEEAIARSWRTHVGGDDGAGGPVELDVRRFGRDVALAFARRFFGLPEGGDAPDRLEHWSEVGYERFIWKLHARHFVEEAPDPSNEALVEIGKLVAARWAEPVPGSMIARLKRHVDDSRQMTDDRLIANVIGSLQGLVDNVMTGACYALAELASSGKLDTVQLLAREGRTEAIRSMLHEAHRADTPSPFPCPVASSPRAVRTSGSGRPGSTRAPHVVCAIGSALSDPSAKHRHRDGTPGTCASGTAGTPARVGGSATT